MRNIVPPKNVVILESPEEMIELVKAHATEEVEVIAEEEVAEAGGEL